MNTDGGFTYTPTQGYQGSDSFTYRANDGTTNSNVATVNITVTPAVTNAAPVAVNDTLTVQQNASATRTAAQGVLANDSDPDANPLTAALVDQPQHGTVNLSANGGTRYTPTPGYQGSDSFTYRANDGTTNSNVATVNITVTPTATNAAPVAVNDTLTVQQNASVTRTAAQGVLANDSDPMPIP